MAKLKFPSALAVPLACAAGLWLVLIYTVAGQSDGNEPRLISHWLRDSTLALPLVLVAVLLGLRIADGMLARRGDRSPSGLAGAVTVAAVALAAGAAMAVELPIRNALFGSLDGTMRCEIVSLFTSVMTRPFVPVVMLGENTER